MGKPTYVWKMMVSLRSAGAWGGNIEKHLSKPEPKPIDDASHTHTSAWSTGGYYICGLCYLVMCVAQWVGIRIYIWVYAKFNRVMVSTIR